MAMNDYVLEDGIDVVGSGDGWSIWHEPGTGKWRFDAFHDTKHFAAPLKDGLELRPYLAHEAVRLLWQRAIAEPEIVQPVMGMYAFAQQRWPLNG